MVTLTWAPRAQAPRKALSLPPPFQPPALCQAHGLSKPKRELAWPMGPAPSQSSEAGNLQGRPEPVFLGD